MQPFAEATSILEEEKRPTLLIVSLHVAKLAKHLQGPLLSPPQRTEMEKIKERALHFLKTKMTLAPEHHIATFLCPQFRHLRMLAPEDREETYQHTKCFLSLLPDGPTEPVDLEPAAKKPFMELFSEWSDVLSSVDAKDEFNEYLNAGTLPPCSPSEILSFWKSKQIKYLTLSILAKTLLVISHNFAFTIVQYICCVLLALTTCRTRELCGCILLYSLYCLNSILCSLWVLLHQYIVCVSGY